MLDVAKILSEVAEIKKMVLKLYNRPMILEPVIENVVPMVHVDKYLGYSGSSSVDSKGDPRAEKRYKKGKGMRIKKY